MGYGIAIGLTTISLRHPRLAYALALICAALFAIYAVGLGIAVAFQYRDAQQWARAAHCNAPGDGCYQTVSATYLGSSTTGNKAELSLRFDVAGQGERDVLVIRDEASAWQRVVPAVGRSASLIQWSGRYPAIDAGSGWIKTEDYPDWDLWKLAAPGFAALVALVLLWFSRELRPRPMSRGDRPTRIELA